jgi:PAS domain S-box-containing protein
MKVYSVSSKLSLLCGIASLLLGLLVLTGWYTHSIALIQIHLSFVPMQFNTALGFLFCGIGLLTASIFHVERRIILVSFVAIAVGGLTLVEYIFALDLGIDQLFMEHFITVKTSHPGRMAPNTALCFTLTGIALTLISSKKLTPWRPSIPEILGALVFALGTVAFSGYLVNLESAYGWGHLTQMALHTSAGFMILGLGIICLSQIEIEKEPNGSGKPHILIGIAALTIAICLWQALKANKIFIEEKSILPAIVFVAGLFYALALSVISYLYQMNPENKQRYHLIIIMILVAISGVGITIHVLYQAAFEERRLELINIVQSQARMMEAIARFDKEQSIGYPGGSLEAALSQFREAHKNFEGFGDTGEYTLAKLENDQIVFLLRHRHSHFPTLALTPTLKSTPFDSTFAEPMKRALKGESGSTMGLDYRGEMVLAAYEPVDVLNLGFVAKVDLSEIREPFINAGLTAGFSGLIVIFFGTFAFFRISDPLIRSIRESEARLRYITDNTNSIIFLKDLLGRYIFINKRFEIISGMLEKEILGKTDYELFSPATADLFTAHDKMVLESGKTQEFDESTVVFGETHTYLAIKSPFLDTDGKPYALCGISTDITARQRKQEKVQKLSKVIQQVPISILITNEAGEIEFVNESLLNLSGYSLEEVLGQNPRMFKSGEPPDSYYKILWDTISKGKEWRGVFHNKKKNGELYWESVLIFPLKDSKGKVTNFIGLKEDITEKKKMESTLIDHERLIRSVVNNLKDGLIIANIEGNIQLFNNGAEKIFGYSPHEVMEKPVAILMDESYKQKHTAGFARFQKTREISHDSALLEVEARKKDGTPVPIELTLTQMEQRGETLVIGLVRDISERKEAEGKHLKSEERFKTIFEEAPMGVAVIESLTGKINAVNPRFSEIVGRNREELLTLDWMSITHPDDVQEDLDNMKLINSGKINGFNMTKRYFLPDNSLVWVSLTVNKMPDSKKDCPIHICMVEDITERKEAERRMETIQKQLISAEKLAGVGELAAGVSHEVLNPVNIISVHTQMLQRKSQDDPAIQQFCSKVKHEINRITKIMGSLLAFSREGDAKLEKGILRDNIEKVLSLVEEEFKLENIELVRNWCDKPVEILYDPDKIRQVYLNLINNAKYAMPQGGTITVGCFGAERDGKKFHNFTLSDTGTGISEKNKLKIFEPFFTTKPEGEGTGMGLSIIHGIIEEHGGRIRVESEESKGTTFHISLPLA